MFVLAKTKRSKTYKIFSVIVLLLVLAIITIRLTGTLQYYEIPTISNEPSIHYKEKIFTTNLKTPKAGDLVTYTSSMTDSMINSFGQVRNKPFTHYIHRLCAIEGDIIEMKNGVFYVNGKNFDSNYNLYHLYIVSKQKTPLLPDSLSDSYPIHSLTDSTDAIALTTTTYKEYCNSFKITPYITNVDSSSSASFKWCNKSLEWSPDNFGPLKIPAGCGFVMGDNRCYALDSRYTGFIELSNIKGVEL